MKNIIENLNKYKAKTNPEKNIIEHTKEVLDMGMKCISKLHFKDKGQRANFKDEIALTLILHDIGKITATFQKSLPTHNEKTKQGTNKKQKTNDMKHNILSWVFVNNYLNVDNSINLDNIKANVLFHHYSDDLNTSQTGENVDVDKYKDIDTNLITNTYDDMKSFFEYMCDYCDTKHETNLKKCFLEENQNTITKMEDMTVFKSVPNDEGNFVSCKRVLGRAILQCCDRDVSKGVIEINMNNEINKDFPLFEKLSLDGYTDKNRLNQQLDVVQQMIDKSDKINTHIVSASAGFGKTLMGLLWVYKTRQKVFWIVPRKEIADNTYNSILDDLNIIKCGNKMNVCLFYSGKIQKHNFNDIDNPIDESDIIVTIIDNPLNFNFKNNLSDKLYETYTRNVIFDEYHEFASHNNAPLFSEFILQMKIRAFYTKSQTLLLSATPIDINKLVGLNYMHPNMKNVEYYNTNIYGGDLQYNLKFIHQHEMYDYIDNETAIILPRRNVSIEKYFEITSYAEQNPGKLNKPISFNGSLIDEDRQDNITKIRSMFGKHADNFNKRLVVGTSVLSTGIDVSFKNLILFAWRPSDFIQSLGRVNRFANYENGSVNIYIVNPCERDNDDKLIYKSDYNFLSAHVFNQTLAQAWIDKLKSEIGDSNTLTKNKIYELYYNFVEENKSAFNSYYENMFEASLTNLSKIKLKKGYSIYIANDDDDNNAILAKSTNHRGDSNDIYGAIPIDGTENDVVVQVIDVNMLTDDKRQDYIKRFDFMKNRMDVDGNISYSKKKLYKKDAEDVRFTKATKNEFLLSMARHKETPMYILQFIYYPHIGLTKLKES